MNERVLCTLVRADPHRRGSGKVSCGDCGRKVWATGSTLELVRGGVSPICTPCGGRLIAASGAPPMLVMTVEARAEAEARRGAFADELGLPADRVTASLPAVIAAAIDSTRRHN